MKRTFPINTHMVQLNYHFRQRNYAPVIRCWRFTWKIFRCSHPKIVFYLILCSDSVGSSQVKDEMNHDRNKLLTRDGKIPLCNPRWLVELPDPLMWLFTSVHCSYKILLFYWTGWVFFPAFAVFLRCRHLSPFSFHEKAYRWQLLDLLCKSAYILQVLKKHNFAIRNKIKISLELLVHPISH